MFNGVRTVPYIHWCRNSSICKTVYEQYRILNGAGQLYYRMTHGEGRVLYVYGVGTSLYV